MRVDWKCPRCATVQFDDVAMGTRERGRAEVVCRMCKEEAVLAVSVSVHLVVTTKDTADPGGLY